jgi:hypothetical protein
MIILGPTAGFNSTREGAPRAGLRGGVRHAPARAACAGFPERRQHLRRESSRRIAECCGS